MVGNTPAELKEANKEGDIPFFKVSDMNYAGHEVFMKHSNIFLNKIDIIKLKIKLYPKETVIFPKRVGAILTNKKDLISRSRF
ncbi:MAG: hypothetical protein IPI98_02885 [Chitinophagaceae bacterium]|nr:hypothetical protein [Chitinophagaceae bacterium]